LEGVCRSHWPEVAWEFSLLTGGGFPLEFSFSSAGETIRYTAEVAGPEFAEAERVRRAAQLLSRLGKKAPAAEVMALLDRIQSAVPLRYGAWIGGRHSREGDRFKLYAEVPKSGATETEGLIHQLLGPEPLLSRAAQGAPQLMMIGHEPESSRLELYFSVEGLEPWEVGWLMKRAGLASREAELLGLIGETYGRSVERRLPGSRLGFSFSVLPDGPDGADGASMIFSIFSYAGSVCGSDQGIRRRLLALAQSRGWDFGSYESLSEPIAGRSVWMTYHTMMTFSVAAEGAPVLHIGLRPPEPEVGL
ncbi:MAG: hypothetical protein ACREAB_02270, partial [Blastocatellia bacterium]